MNVGRHIRQLAGESAVYGLSSVLVRFLGVLLIPLYTRVFSPGEFGVVALVDTLVGLLSMVAVLGLDNSAGRWFYESEETAHRKTTISSYFWTQLAAAALLVGVLVAAGGPISRSLLGGSEYHLVLAAALALIPLSGANRVAESWFRLQRRPLGAVLVSAVITAGNVGLVILFVVVFRGGILGLYLGRLTAAALAVVLALALLRDWIDPRRVEWGRVKEMVVFGLPMIPASVGLWLTMAANRWFLEWLRTREEVGIYAIAASLASGVGLLTGAFTQAWGPFAFSIHKEDGAKLVYARVLDLYGYLGAWVCAAVALFAPLLLRAFATEPYYAAADCVGILGFSVLVSQAGYIAVIGTGLAKRSGPVAIGTLVAGVGNVVFDLALIPVAGIEGAAVALLAANLLCVAYLFRASQQRYAIPYRWANAIVPVVVAGLLALAGAQLPEVGLVPNVLKALLLALLLPLGLWLGILRGDHFTRLVRMGRAAG